MKRFVVIFFAIAFTACEVTDLNTPCTLVRGNPDGGRAIPLLKDDPIIKNSANKDFISFGSPECENQVCVRDSAFTEKTDGGTADNNPNAQGYCSSACVVNSSIGCSSYSGALDSDPHTALSCRPLILDEATLAALKAKDESVYQRYFGMTKSPYFCARSQVVPDAGP